MAREDAFKAEMAGPSNSNRALSGSIPGILDPTQPSRLLRTPGAKLSFAAFDPRLATDQDVPDFRQLSLNEELYRPKRIVVETIPTGESFWRFVPSARKEDGVVDEGSWPRIIEICGDLFECTQDQWDIYKLDPLYDCYVRAPPALSVVTPAPQKVPQRQPSPGKRRMASTSPHPDSPDAHPARKTRTTVVDSFSDSEEDEEEYEVEEMIVDDGFTPRRSWSQGPPSKAKRYKEETMKNRRERREKLFRRAERLTREEQASRFNFSQNNTHQPQPSPDSTMKRKVNVLFDSLRTQEDPHFLRPEEADCLRNTVNYTPAKQWKRTRTVSPSSAKRELDSKRFEREKQKRERREQEQQARRQEREKRFMSEILADIPEMQDLNDVSFDDYLEEVSMNGHEEYDRPSSNFDGQENVGPEEAERLAAIEESRRKLAELERDRPLWEEQAKMRMMAEKAEEEAMKAKAERKRRAEAAKMEAERRRAQEEARIQEEALRREREEMLKRQNERRYRQQRWESGPWSAQRALERYKILCESFDATKFSEKDPLTMDAIPWPTLHPPNAFSVEDVDWAAVEKFFAAVKMHMRTQDYKQFVQNSHRRFHPDRWRSRSLLKSISDEAERGCIEVAANTVAQALTPLWRDLTGR